MFLQRSTKTDEIVKFPANHGFAFRGCNEKLGCQTNGNFSRNTDLISYYDSFLSEDLIKYGNVGSVKTSYLPSKFIYSELVHLMG